MITVTFAECSDTRELSDTTENRKYITKLSWSTQLRVSHDDGRMWDVGCGQWLVI